MKNMKTLGKMKLYRLSEEVINLAQNQDPFFNYLTYSLVTPYFKLKKAKVLDLGCGAGRNLLASARKGYKVTGIDINSKALAIARKRVSQEGLSERVTIIKMDLTKFKGKSRGVYDYCILQEVIEHLANYQKAFDLAYKELKKGGILIITTPNDPGQWNLLDDYAGHVRRFTTDEIRLALYKFSRIKIYTVGFPFHRLGLYMYNLYLKSRSGGHNASLFRKNRWFVKFYFITGSLLLKFDHLFRFTPWGTTILAVAVK